MSSRRKGIQPCSLSVFGKESCGFLSESPRILFMQVCKYVKRHFSSVSAHATQIFQITVEFLLTMLALLLPE